MTELITRSERDFLPQGGSFVSVLDDRGKEVRKFGLDIPRHFPPISKNVSGTRSLVLFHFMYSRH